jgi:hypothetical protein
MQARSAFFRRLLASTLWLGLAGTANAQQVADVTAAFTFTPPPNAKAGETGRFVATFTNNGPDASDGAPYELFFMPQPFASVVSATCQASGGAVCTNPDANGNSQGGQITTFPPGSSVTVEIIGTYPPTSPRPFQVRASTAPGPAPGLSDPNPGNNDAQAQTLLPVSLQSFDVEQASRPLPP